MKARKFCAATSREVLHLVRDALGADAVVLSNRRVAAGVEIIALASADMSCLVTAPTEEAVRGQAEPRPVLTEPVVQSIIREIQSMRGTLQEQIATLAWGDLQRREPARAGAMRALLGAGFSPALARQLLERLPAGYGQEQSLQWAQATLTRNLRTVAADSMVERGGIYALVGPTGVGKTTTTAKLAARCVIRHGADKVALLTTDSYRIGGHEQLRIYGKLLGVPVRAIKDGEDLQFTLTELRGRHLVLIDTVGVGQRDQMVAEQMAMLSGCSDVQRLLLLNATSNADTLDDVVRAYQRDGLSGSIITKVDEAASLGAVLDTLIRHKLALHYVANGQRVPEDLHQANPRYLLHRALQKTQAHSRFALQNDEFALLMADSDGVGGAAPLPQACAEAGHD